MQNNIAAAIQAASERARATISLIDSDFVLAADSGMHVRKTAGAALLHFASNPPFDPVQRVKAIRAKLARGLKEAGKPLDEASAHLRHIAALAEFIAGRGAMPKDAPPDLKSAATTLREAGRVGTVDADAIAAEVLSICRKGRAQISEARKLLAHYRATALAAANKQAANFYARHSGCEAWAKKAREKAPQLEAARKRRKQAAAAMRAKVKEFGNG